MICGCQASLRKHHDSNRSSWRWHPCIGNWKNLVSTFGNMVMEQPAWHCASAQEILSLNLGKIAELACNGHHPVGLCGTRSPPVKSSNIYLARRLILRLYAFQISWNRYGLPCLLLWASLLSPSTKGPLENLQTLLRMHTGSPHQVQDFGQYRGMSNLSLFQRKKGGPKLSLVEPLLEL